MAIVAPATSHNSDTAGRWPLLYGLWATLAIGTALSIAGLNAESVTRLLVLALLAVQYLSRERLIQALRQLHPRLRFITLATGYAAVVEGFHMISKPVYASLLVGPETSLREALRHYAIDLLVTVPAYLVIFGVIWVFIRRYRYGLWTYIVTMGLAQALGDGGLFYFINAPQQLFFLPYPMSNYHACNVLPFLAVRNTLDPARSATWQRWLVLPAVIATYLACGTLIKLAGRAAGLE